MMVFVFNEIDLNSLPVGIKNTVYKNQEDIMWQFRELFPDEKERYEVMKGMGETGMYFDQAKAKVYIIKPAEYREG